MKGDCSGGFGKEAGRIALYIIHFSGRGSILSVLKREFQVKVLSVTCVCVYVCMVQLLPLPLALGEEVFLLLQVLRYFQGHREKPCGIRNVDIKCRGYSTSFDLWGLKCNFWLQPTF